ncbi:hypothetical protein EDC01DRAFT_393898 [Geopyxis carbonaria]|nr:hypothetical protein EDC01DRAFT_393898 [Geopyxis carbonaria]
MFTYYQRGFLCVLLFNYTPVSVSSFVYLFYCLRFDSHLLEGGGCRSWGGPQKGGGFFSSSFPHTSVFGGGGGGRSDCFRPFFLHFRSR